VIEGGVEIGAGCVLGPHVSVLRHTALGPRCRVHAGATLGDVPQDRAFKGGESALRIGADCDIREGVTVHRGTTTGSTTTIGERVMLMAFCHVAHNAVVGDDATITNGALLGGHVEVGAGAYISGNCLVHQFTRIGRLAMLAGGSAIYKDLPPFLMTPAMSLNQVMRPNVVGLRRAGFDAAGLREIKRAFDIVYRSGLLVTDAVGRVRAECPGPLGQEFAGFIEGASRGVCRLFTRAERQAHAKP